MEDVTPKINLLTVSKLNKYIKNMLEDDYVLKDLFVSGEVSNLKKHTSGHYYFTLKDGKSQISAVMFKSYTSSLKFDLREGMKVSVCGYVSMYEAYGTFQLYVENIFEDGIGTLAKQFEELKCKLEQKGYFEQKHKKEIPELVKTVAVLTAKDGAAVEDVIRTIRRRNDLIKIIVVPTIVQGVLSKDSIVSSIQSINKYSEHNDNCIDVVILGRGGGSLEDLWSFNEEEVVEAIFKSKLPIISAVGHEINFTLSDFVADLRASTPTAAAEMVSIEKSTLVYTVYEQSNRLNKLMSLKLERNKSELNYLLSRNCLRRPEVIIYNEQDKIQDFIKSLNNQIEKTLVKNKNTLSENLTKLDLLNPIKILNNGYTLTYKDSSVIKSSKELKKDDEVTIRFSDGETKAIIK